MGFFEQVYSHFYRKHVDYFFLPNVHVMQKIILTFLIKLFKIYISNVKFEKGIHKLRDGANNHNL
jgi:hypothetical protein